jgi:DNA-binding NarL/FixJ family response regulator
MAEPSKVLVVDPQPLIRRALGLLLRDCAGASDVVEAATMDDAAATHVPVDLAVIGLCGTVHAGLDGLKAFLAAHPHVPVAIVASHGDPALVETALALGARGFILTSLRPEVFRSAIELIRSGEVYVPAELMLPHPSNGNGAPSRTAQAPVGRLLGMLSLRQRDVLRHLSRGRSNKEIARLLEMNEGTVKLHVTAILRQLGVKNRTEAALIAARSELGEPH